MTKALLVLVGFGAAVALTSASAGARSRTAAVTFLRLARHERSVICTSTSDSANATRAVRLSGRYWELAWSPQGKRVAVVTLTDKRHGAGALVVMRSDGTQKRVVAQRRLPVGRVSPTWSPNGRNVAFVGAYGLFVAEAGGRAPKLIVNLRDALAHVWSPTWTTQGRIFFTLIHVGIRRVQGQTLPHYDAAMSVRPDGSDLRVEEIGAGIHDVRLGWWSPDGSARATFGAFDCRPDSRTGSSCDSTLEVLSRNGSETRELVRGSVDPQPPAWSPDGRALAYLRYPLGERGGQADVWVVDVATGDTHPLTQTRAYEHAVAWRSGLHSGFGGC